MKVFERQHLTAAKEKYQDAVTAIDSWYKAAENAKWQHIMEVRQTFSSASTVEGYVVFNIRGNNYRLVTVIRYPQGLIFIRSFLTHKQYEDRSNWDKGVL